MATKPPLCIYHGGCKDGFTAAWVVRRKYSNAEFYPGVYQKDPPDVTGRDVIVVDFSYKRPVMLELAAKAKSVLVLDHHESAERDLKDLPRATTIFDMNRSGAGLAWDHYFPEYARPSFINYVEDRDLWRKALPDNDEFSAGLGTYPMTFECWDMIALNSVLPLIEEGRPVLRYVRQKIDAFKLQSYTASLAGVYCRIANIPYQFASEVAGEIIELDPDAQFGACFFQKADGHWQYSLRSEGEFSVSAIAEKFGGGGHKNASGFSSPYIVHTRIEKGTNQ